MDSERERTILIVEDEQSIADLHAHHLQGDYNIRVAYSGGQALVELTPEVDLILLDRRMPGMTGDELLSHIEGGGTDCQVIMVTAVDPDFDIVDMPITGYLNKPVDEDELVTAVEQAFLIEKYEALVDDYYEARKKHATLTSEFSSQKEDNGKFDKIEAEIDELEAEIDKTLDQLPDGDFRESFEQIHQNEA